MFAVCVTFEIAPGQMAAFMPLMLANAQASLRDEPGCHQFDVLTDPARPDEVGLYELYADAVAFDAHLASPHFKTFDTKITPMIAAKSVQTYSKVVS